MGSRTIFQGSGRFEQAALLLSNCPECQLSENFRVRLFQDRRFFAPHMGWDCDPDADTDCYSVVLKNPFLFVSIHVVTSCFL